MSWSVERWRLIPGLEQSFGDRHEAAPPRTVTLRQVHGCVLHGADEAESGKTEGDGLAIDRPGQRAGVWTADCVPVHLVAPGARVAAAVHCGWRGSAAGMVPAALAFLERRWGVRPRDLEAALGPSIGGCCYEVGGEVREAFVARAGGSLGSAGFETRAGRPHLDLRSFLAAELRALGVETVDRVGPCTSCHTDVLCSYRREGTTGRQLGWIGWRRRSRKIVVEEMVGC